HVAPSSRGATVLLFSAGVCSRTSTLQLGKAPVCQTSRVQYRPLRRGMLCAYCLPNRRNGENRVAKHGRRILDVEGYEAEGAFGREGRRLEQPLAQGPLGRQGRRLAE